MPQQLAQDDGVALPGGGQHRGAVVGHAAVGVGAGLEQRQHALQVLAAHGGEERRLRLDVHAVDVGAVGQQHLQAAQVALGGGHAERCAGDAPTAAAVDDPLVDLLAEHLVEEPGIVLGDGLAKLLDLTAALFLHRGLELEHRTTCVAGQG